MDIYSNGKLIYTVNLERHIKYTTDNTNANVTIKANLQMRSNSIIGINIYFNNTLVKTVGEYCLKTNAENVYTYTTQVTRAQETQKIPVKIETFCASTADKTVDGVTYSPITGHTTTVSDFAPIASKGTAAPSHPFNKDLDKITEAEVVFDFVERLSIGKIFTLSRRLFNSSLVGTLFSAKTKLLDIIERIFISLPAQLVVPDKLMAYRIPITKGATTISQNFTDSSAANYNLQAAYTDKARVDVTSIIGITHTNNTTITVSIKFDSPYPYNDIIMVYFKK